MRNAHYSPLLKMLWNFESNVMVLGNFGLWDKTEDKLIAKAKEIQTLENNKIKIGIMDLVTIEERKRAILTPFAIELDAMANGIDYLVDYSVNDNFEMNMNQLEMFKGIKNNLNVQKVVVRKEFKIGDDMIDTNALNEVFGIDNVYIVEPISDHKNIDELKDDLEKGNVKKYKNTTGVHYSYSGHVEEGKKVGRTIGYPTANLEAPVGFPLKKGVYYTRVQLPNEETLRDGMTCYWTNEHGKEVIETYIFDFNKDIYGYGITVHFIDFVRDNKDVKSLEELKDLLSDDDRLIRIEYIGG